MLQSKTIRLAGLLAVLLAACGGSTMPRATTAAPAAQAADEGGVSWQARLDTNERGKVTQKLWLWLDGDEPSGLGLVTADSDKVRVSAVLRHAVYADEVAHYADLGLVVREGESRPSGAVNRDDLLRLAQEHNVLRLDPVQAEDLPAPAPAEEMASEPTETASAGSDASTM